MLSPNQSRIPSKSYGGVQILIAAYQRSLHRSYLAVSFFVISLVLAHSATEAQNSEQPASASDPPQEQRLSEGTGPFAAGLLAGNLTLQAHKLRGLTAEVANLILRSEIGGPIAFEVLATPIGGSETHIKVPVFVEIDGPALLESNHSRVARIEIYAYALGAGQKIGGFLAEAFAVDTQEVGEAVWQSGLKYFGSLELLPGDYKLRVLVRNYQSKAASLRELAIRVPKQDAFNEAFILPPVFSPPAERDAWILATRDLGEELARYPFFDEEGSALNPAVRPVLAAGRRSKAHLLGAGLPDSAVGGLVQWFRGDSLVESSPFEITAAGSSNRQAALKALEIGFVVPPIEPGTYEIRTNLAATAGSSAVLSPPITVAIVQQPAGDRGLQWTDLRSPRSSTLEVTKATSKAPDGKKKGRRARNLEEKRRVGELATGYREALSLLGLGKASDARSAILDLEAAILTDGAISSLRAAELQVAEELASSDVESLIPVLVLHDEIYLIYRRRSIYSLSSNARLLIENLAELYAEKGGSEGSHIVASRALASLGGRLQRANLPASSRRLYERALHHDPKNEAAALGLATSFERHGDYRQAIDVLEHLVTVHPTYGEGLLRLAVNLRRIGILTRTKDLLSQVTELEAPGWVRAVASQELARSLMVAGDIQEATRLLEASVEELPDQQATRFLLAHLYDRQRLAAKALEILKIETAGSGDDSARKIYDGWPRQPLDNVRAELSRAAAMRAPLIARILKRSGSGEGQ